MLFTLFGPGGPYQVGEDVTVGTTPLYPVNVSNLEDVTIDLCSHEYSHAIGSHWPWAGELRPVAYDRL